MRRPGAWLLAALATAIVAGSLRPAAMVKPGEALESVPPQLAVASVAFAGLNGLIADVLWLRASQQQDQGEFYEMQQTAEWIAALQPRLGGLYDFQAWNLAYNIAGQFRQPADRWRWIQAGLALLLRDGLARNPADPDIDQSLASILAGKLVDDTDPGADWYRARWAEEWGERSPAADRRRREHWRMTPEGMAAVDASYGPFDWRAPEPHVVYWTASAIAKAGQPSIVLERMLYQGLWAACLRGTLREDPETGGWQRTPDPRLIAVVERELEQALDLFPGDSGLLVARANILSEAVVLDWFFDRRAAAERYQRLRALYPGVPDYRQPLDVFVERSMAEYPETTGSRP